MLPRRHRMRTSAQFAQVLRKGRRGSTSALVVHALARDAGPSALEPPLDDSATTRASSGSTGDGLSGAASDEPVIVGFVVGKAVGNSVQRHRVTRQLRAVVAPRLDELDRYRGVVVRALPPAAERPTAELAGDLATALRRLGDRPRRPKAAAEGAPRAAASRTSSRS